MKNVNVVEGNIWHVKLPNEKIVYTVAVIDASKHTVLLVDVDDNEVIARFKKSDVEFIELVGQFDTTEDTTESLEQSNAPLQ